MPDNKTTIEEAKNAIKASLQKIERQKAGILLPSQEGGGRTARLLKKVDAANRPQAAPTTSTVFAFDPNPSDIDERIREKLKKKKAKEK